MGRRRRGPGLSTFAQRQQDYLQNYENARMDEDQKIWAWFERGRGYNGDKSKNSDIDRIINQWFVGTNPENSGWTSSHGITRLHLLRVMKKYPNCVSPGDLNRIKTQFHSMAYSDNGSDIWNCGSSNGVVTRKAAAFIYLEDHRDANVIWPLLPNYCQGNFNGASSFGYGGRNYQHGQRYNGYDIVRDWLYSTFDRWVDEGDWTGEFDAFYTPPLIYALYTLYDFAQDETMKRKAKMMLDMMLLESILDVCNNSNGEGMHGGVPGRTYGDQMLGKTEPCIFWYPLWGLTRSGYQFPWHTFANIYLSDYADNFAKEGLIDGIGCLVKEPHDYHHMVTKYQKGGGSRGKFTYVTKNYSIGSVVTSQNRWIINVLSRNDKSGSGMRIWIDHFPQIPGPSGGEYYLEYGESGYQYQNAILAFSDQGKNYLHFADYNRNDAAGNSFDTDEMEGYWRFLRKDEAGASVAMAVQMGSNAQAIEMCQIGLDYPSYDDFKSAVKSKANLQDNPYGTFTTSKGHRIGREYDSATGRYYMLVNGRRAFPDGTPDNGQNAKRLECVDQHGNKIVEWNNRIMTLAKNGPSVIYNFVNWLVEGQSTIPRVATPIINPDGGTFTGPVMVTLRSNTGDAAIYYTTDGSTPTTQSTRYTAPFQVNKNITVIAKGFRAGYLDSYLSFAYFTMIVDQAPPAQVAAPTINPDGGIFTEPVLVTLNTETSGAEIFYTTDGGTPTQQSELYTAPFTLNNSATIKAKAFKADMADSEIAAATIAIGKTIIGDAPPAAETIIDDDDNSQVIYDGAEWEEIKHVNDSFGGRAHWHYNNQGGAATWRPRLGQTGEYEIFVWWGEGSGGLGTKVPYTINHANGSTTIYMNQNSAPAQWHSLGKYVFNAGAAGIVKMSDECGDKDRFVVADAIKFVRAGSAIPKVAAPVVSPNGGVSAEAVLVTLSTNTEDASIRYTTDGSAPTTESNLYKEPLLLSDSAIVRAKAFKAGLLDSDESAAVFTIGEVKQPTEMVIDDNDKQVVYVGESWEEVSHLNNSFGGHAHWHWNNQGASVTWRFSLAQAGAYEVFAWWGDGYGGLGAKVPYTINHANGSATVRLDQNAEPEQWHSLGIYTFNAGAAGYVKMTDETGDSGKFVVADAIKLVFAGTRGRRGRGGKRSGGSKGKRGGKDNKTKRRRKIGEKHRAPKDSKKKKDHDKSKRFWQ